MDNHTEQLADGCWRIEVAPFTNAFLLADAGGRLTLVDTGLNRSGPRLVRSIRLIGLDPTTVDDVVLTHWHADHTGSVARFASSSAAPRVWVGRGDVAAVRGEQPHPQADADASRLVRLVGRLSKPGAPVPAAQPLDGGHTLAGSAVVVDSPGHTPGHISLHLPDRGVLIAGDAVMNVLRLTRDIPLLRSAPAQAVATLQRLAALEFDVLAPGHGPPVVTQAQARLRRLADRAAAHQRAAA